MVKLKNEMYLFLLSAVGMIGMIILLAMGKNGVIEIAFLALNGLGIGTSSIKSIRKVVKNGSSSSQTDQGSSKA